MTNLMTNLVTNDFLMSLMSYLGEIKEKQKQQFVAFGTDLFPG